MEQHDFQLKVFGNTAVSNTDPGDVLSEKVRAIEDVFKSDPLFSDVQVYKVNPRDDLKTFVDRLNKDYENLHEDDDK